MKNVLQEDRTKHWRTQSLVVAVTAMCCKKIVPTERRTVFDRSNHRVLQVDGTNGEAYRVFDRSNDGMLQDRTLAHTAFDRSNDRVAAS